MFVDGGDKGPGIVVCTWRGWGCGRVELGGTCAGRTKKAVKAERLSIILNLGIFCYDVR